MIFFTTSGLQVLHARDVPITMYVPLTRERCKMDDAVRVFEVPEDTILDGIRFKKGAYITLGLEDCTAFKVSPISVRQETIRAALIAGVLISPDRPLSVALQGLGASVSPPPALRRRRVRGARVPS